MSKGTEGRLRRLEGQLLPRNKRGRVKFNVFWGNSPEAEAARAKGGRVFKVIYEKPKD